MKRILVIVMAMALACVCLVGCGSADFEGKWECEEMSLGGMSIKGDFMGVPVAVSMQIELEKDGKGKHLKLDKEYNVTSDAITWSADGSKCKTTIDGYEIELEKDGSKLIGEYSCQGYNTFGPFKLVGGTAKGHPTEDEIAGAVRFYETLL